MDKVKTSKSFQITNDRQVSAQNFMHENFEQFDMYIVDMQAAPGEQMTPNHIEKLDLRLHAWWLKLPRCVQEKVKPQPHQ